MKYAVGIKSESIYVTMLPNGMCIPSRTSPLEAVLFDTRAAADAALKEMKGFSQVFGDLKVYEARVGIEICEVPQ
jgi:hypothetical protein